VARISELLPQFPSIDTPAVMADEVDIVVLVDEVLVVLLLGSHVPKPLWHPVPQ